MTDKEFLINLLSDGCAHTGAEIELRSKLTRNVGLTIHSRVADLRKDGYEIEVTPIPHLRTAVYKLIAKHDRRVRVRDGAPVQGYTFVSNDDDNRRNQTICKILRRAAISDVEAAENGPAFWVEFGDGQKSIVFGEELHPWYPV